MSDERKSRYELFLEEEARQAQPTKRRTSIYKRKFKDRVDRFWKTYWAKVERVGDCLEWTGKTCGYRHSVPYGKWDKKSVNLRRLVYRLAIDELPDDMFVVATCKNRRCVRHAHLRRVTKEEYDTFRWDRSAMPADRILRGARVGSAKLDEQNVREIRNLYDQGGVTKSDLARRFGVDSATIRRAISRRNWAHVQ